ncbi:MAG: DUF4350 domain-containing protein [Gemmatimonadota bacterium]|nr:DUF4350 domain-containing protein [Gemmatimonadota bacterium]
MRTTPPPYRPRCGAILLSLALTLVPTGHGVGQQVADSTFDVSVARPAHTRSRPVVMIDEAHQNFHTAVGRYEPFARLLRNDGYRVVRGTEKVTPAALRGVNVFVISNAEGANAAGDSLSAAFTETECDVIRDWVRAGGALLLVADHAPFGRAAENLARRFDVEFGKGFVYDSTASLEGGLTFLVFSRPDSGLGNHVILRGRDPSERVARVITFTGQSMTVPPRGVALLKLSDNAREGPTRDDVLARRGAPAAGRAQGIALTFGRGRVVVLGEAAMLSAQIARWEQDGKTHEFLMGMNHPGSDDKQFALNVMRWLTRVLN